MKFHIYKKSTDDKALCGNKNKDYALYVEGNYFGRYKFFNFFRNTWAIMKLPKRCSHCEEKLQKLHKEEQKA